MAWPPAELNELGGASPLDGITLAKVLAQRVVAVFIASPMHDRTDPGSLSPSSGLVVLVDTSVWVDHFLKASAQLRKPEVWQPLPGWPARLLRPGSCDETHG